MINANTMYKTSDLKQLGIGPLELMRARKAGVQPVTISNKHWYFGGDLIAWMRNKDSATNGASDGMDSGQDAHFSTELVSRG